jgi:hypothetical protein
MSADPHWAARALPVTVFPRPVANSTAKRFSGPRVMREENASMALS